MVIQTTNVHTNDINARVRALTEPYTRLGGTTEVYEGDPETFQCSNEAKNTAPIRSYEFTFGAETITVDEVSCNICFKVDHLKSAGIYTKMCKLLVVDDTLSFCRFFALV